MHYYRSGILAAIAIPVFLAQQRKAEIVPGKLFDGTYRVPFWERFSLPTRTKATPQLRYPAGKAAVKSSHKELDEHYEQ